MTGAARQPDVEAVAAAAGPAGGGGTAAGAPADLPAAAAGQAEAAAELAAAKAEAEERTADLKRITAEYANYRKRVERDRLAVVEGATGAVLANLLPVLDDIERARAHGDLTGAFKAVADQLEAALEKLGLQPFGAVGDAFDPMLHEAVAHQGTADGTVPTCMVVLRKGFRHGDRLLRPALVTVADPVEEALTGTAEPIAPTDLLAPDQSGNDPAAGAGEPAAEHPAGTPEPPAAAWTPPKSAPGGSGSSSGSGSSAAAQPRADAAADADVDEDGGTPVIWFGGEPGEQQQD